MRKGFVDHVLGHLAKLKVPGPRSTYQVIDELVKAYSEEPKFYEDPLQGHNFEIKGLPVQPRNVELDINGTSGNLRFAIAMVPALASKPLPSFKELEVVVELPDGQKVTVFKLHPTQIYTARFVVDAGKGVAWMLYEVPVIVSTPYTELA